MEVIPTPVEDVNVQAFAKQQMNDTEVQIGVITSMKTVQTEDKPPLESINKKLQVELKALTTDSVVQCEGRHLVDSITEVDHILAKIPSQDTNVQFSVQPESYDVELQCGIRQNEVICQTDIDYRPKIPVQDVAVLASAKALSVDYSFGVEVPTVSNVIETVEMEVIPTPVEDVNVQAFAKQQMNDTEVQIGVITSMKTVQTEDKPPIESINKKLQVELKAMTTDSVVQCEGRHLVDSITEVDHIQTKIPSRDANVQFSLQPVIYDVELQCGVHQAEFMCQTDIDYRPKIPVQDVGVHASAKPLEKDYSFGDETPTVINVVPETFDTEVQCGVIQVTESFQTSPISLADLSVTVALDKKKTVLHDAITQSSVIPDNVDVELQCGLISVVSAVQTDDIRIVDTSYVSTECVATYQSIPCQTDFQLIDAQVDATIRLHSIDYSIETDEQIVEKLEPAQKAAPPPVEDHSVQCAPPWGMLDTSVQMGCVLVTSDTQTEDKPQLRLLDKMLQAGTKSVIVDSVWQIESGRCRDFSGQVEHALQKTPNIDSFVQCGVQSIQRQNIATQHDIRLTTASNQTEFEFRPKIPVSDAAVHTLTESDKPIIVDSSFHDMKSVFDAVVPVSFLQSTKQDIGVQNEDMVNRVTQIRQPITDTELEYIRPSVDGSVSHVEMKSEIAYATHYRTPLSSLPAPTQLVTDAACYYPGPERSKVQPDMVRTTSSLFSSQRNKKCQINMFDMELLTVKESVDGEDFACQFASEERKSPVHYIESDIQVKPHSLNKKMQINTILPISLAAPPSPPPKPVMLVSARGFHLQTEGVSLEEQLAGRAGQSKSYITHIVQVDGMTKPTSPIQSTRNVSIQKGNSCIQTYLRDTLTQTEVDDVDSFVNMNVVHPLRASPQAQITNSNVSYVTSSPAVRPAYSPPKRDSISWGVQCTPHTMNGIAQTIDSMKYESGITKSAESFSIGVQTTFDDEYTIKRVVTTIARRGNSSIYKRSAPVVKHIQASSRVPLLTTSLPSQLDERLLDDVEDESEYYVQTPTVTKATVISIDGERRLIHDDGSYRARGRGRSLDSRLGSTFRLGDSTAHDIELIDEIDGQTNAEQCFDNLIKTWGVSYLLARLRRRAGSMSVDFQVNTGAGMEACRLVGVRTQYTSTGSLTMTQLDGSTRTMDTQTTGLFAHVRPPHKNKRIQRGHSFISPTTVRNQSVAEASPSVQETTSRQKFDFKTSYMETFHEQSSSFDRPDTYMCPNCGTHTHIPQFSATSTSNIQSLPIIQLQNAPSQTPSDGYYMLHTESTNLPVYINDEDMMRLNPHQLFPEDKQLSTFKWSQADATQTEKEFGRKLQTTDEVCVESPGKLLEARVTGVALPGSDAYISAAEAFYRGILRVVYWNDANVSSKTVPQPIVQLTDAILSNLIKLETAAPTNETLPTTRSSDIGVGVPDVHVVWATKENHRTRYAVRTIRQDSKDRITTYNVKSALKEGYIDPVSGEIVIMHPDFDAGMDSQSELHYSKQKRISVQEAIVRGILDVELIESDRQGSHSSAMDRKITLSSYSHHSPRDTDV